MDTTVLVALITGSFSFLTFILTRHFASKDKQTEQVLKDDARYEQLEQEQAKQEKDVQRLQNTVDSLIKMQEQQNAALSKLSDATRSTLRNDIIQMYNRYTSSDYGYMPIHERENLEHLTQDYYALDGNGVIPGLVEQMLALPANKPESND